MFSKVFKGFRATCTYETEGPEGKQQALYDKSFKEGNNEKILIKNKVSEE